MHKYRCPECGRHYYSAAKQSGPKCPDCANPDVRTNFARLTESPETLADFIQKVNLGTIRVDMLYCNGSCGNDEDCPHELQCIINWLNQSERRDKPCVNQ